MCRLCSAAFTLAVYTLRSRWVHQRGCPGWALISGCAIAFPAGVVRCLTKVVTRWVVSSSTSVWHTAPKAWASVQMVVLHAREALREQLAVSKVRAIHAYPPAHLVARRRTAPAQRAGE